MSCHVFAWSPFWMLKTKGSSWRWLCMIVPKRQVQTFAEIHSEQFSCHRHSRQNKKRQHSRLFSPSNISNVNLSQTRPNTDRKLSFFFFLNAIPINTACVTSLLAVPLNVEDWGTKLKLLVYNYTKQLGAYICWNVQKPMFLSQLTNFKYLHYIYN